MKMAYEKFVELRKRKDEQGLREEMEKMKESMRRKAKGENMDKTERVKNRKIYIEQLVHIWELKVHNRTLLWHY